MVRVVDRVARILAAFTVEQPELTLTECARACDLNKTSVLRLLSSLEAVGLVERSDSRWRLGPKILVLATARVGGTDLRREAVRHLRELRRTFRSAVAFSVPEGSDMFYLERFDSPDAFGVSARLGARAPIWAGASGKAILSRMDPDERELRLNTEEWRRLPNDVRTSVLEEIDRASERGFCIDHGDFFQGIGGVASSIRDSHNDPVAAISVILPGNLLTSEYAGAIGNRLLISASELEQTIGAGSLEI